MNISINIPSYKRHYVETLEYLPDAKVWVCESEYEGYKNQNALAEIIPCEKGIQGNTSRIRNHIIQTELGNGMDAVCIIDDDMKGVFYWENLEKKLVDKDNFMEFLEKYSFMAMELGVYLWGVNPNNDKQSYAEFNPFSSLSFIGAPFMVFLKGNNCWFDERLPLKEDYDMTLQQINKNRKVLRINKYFYRVKQSNQTGGCAAFRNYDYELEQLELLQQKWGEKIVKLDNKNRSNNMKKEKKKIDYNPIIKVPIKGV
jgi:hypothetical protein